MSAEIEESIKKNSFIKGASLVVGPVVCVSFIILFDLDPGHPEVTRIAAVALLMAIWWISEAVPLAITSLLPIVLFPTLGIMSGKVVAPIYFNQIIFLFIGGFLIALAMQRWNLHKRIAFKIMLYCGPRPGSILLGFMVTTWFLSMWISNTAATMMMIPIALSVIMNLEEHLGRKAVKRYAIGVFLGIAYGASIGGIATLVGTPPNLSFVRILSINFPNAPDISFARWFAFGFPISLVFLVCVWLFLSMLYSTKEGFKLDKDIFKKKYQELGSISFEEGVVLIVFVLLIFLWLFRVDIRIGSFIIPGWSAFFSQSKFLNDGTVAVAMAIILFVVPSKNHTGSRIMDWNAISRLPWDIVLLFGGGFALASGFKNAGLSMWLGKHLQGLGGLHPIFMVIAICVIVTFLTEFTSNTATTEMILPLLAALATAIKVNPLLLMIPGTLSCSFAFMLPAATPPNAIVFGSQRLQISDMVKTGFLLNILGIVITTVGIYLLGRIIFDIDLTYFPEWAKME